MNWPAFSLDATDGHVYTPAHFSTGIHVLYLYPKDMTSGCTREAHDFESLLSQFKTLGAQVYGLSKDSMKRHTAFCDKENITFPLLSDPDCVLINALGSWVEKSMYGRKYMGIDRSTFLIQDGEIVQEWRKVKVPKHAETVLKALQELNK